MNIARLQGSLDPATGELVLELRNGDGLEVEVASLPDGSARNATAYSRLPSAAWMGAWSLHATSGATATFVMQGARRPTTRSRTPRCAPVLHEA